MDPITHLTPPYRPVRILQISNCLGFLLMIIINFLANSLPINGLTTGEVANKYDNLFTPAGITFSIWGVIYLLLLVFTLYQASTLFKRKPSRINTLILYIGVWYFVSSLLNAAWIFAWHYELIPVSVSIMLTLLLALVLLNFGIYNFNTNLPKWECLLVKAAFGIYLGWICVATIANISTWLTAIHWKGGLAESTWTVIVVLSGAVLTFYAARRLSNPFITLAVVWAFLGIVIKHSQAEPMNYAVLFTAGAAAIGLLWVTITGIVRELRQNKTFPLSTSDVPE
jgi:hypothetical protein